MLGNAAKLGTVWGVVVMLMIAAALLGLVIAVQRKLVVTGWDPSPDRAAPVGSAESAAGTAVTGARSYPKIPRHPRGAGAATAA